MTTTADISEFVGTTGYDDLSPAVVDAVKKRLLDAVAIAAGAIGAEPVEIVRATVAELDDGGPCSIWGSSMAASPPEATMLNTAMTRYLDFMDAVLLPGETPHPSDNVGAAVATAEYDDRSGEALLAGVAVAYEVHAAMAAAAPGRDRGWDHIQVTFGATAAAAKLLGLDDAQTRNALGIATAASNPLRVTRTGAISMWKGVASANLARNAVYAAMLARNGMEGPTDALEGQKGWKEVVVGGDFEAEFTPGERVLDVLTKKYMAGTHAQTAIEALLELLDRDGLAADEVERVDVATYESAAHVMGGGEGSRHVVRNREQADHSLPYTLAVAALDGAVGLEQYEPERIRADDVQSFMERIDVSADPELTRRQRTGAQPYRIEVTTADGSTHAIEAETFEGHPDDPMSWDQLEAKFEVCASGRYDAGQRADVVETIRALEDQDARDLVAVLRPPPG